MLSQAAQSEIRTEIAKYPQGHARAAVMAALRIGQDECGWVSEELMECIARMLEIEPIKVAEVATFYSMYDCKPVGRHKISLCTNITCMLRGSRKIAEHLNESLGIDFGETTDDGRFTLHEVECLAACGGAPAALIDRQYYENLTAESLDKVLETLE